jgi:hypothetical protein
MPEPQASLPYMPGYGDMVEASGGKTLSWSWAVARLAESRNLWLTTIRPEGGPHMMPIWGVWRDGAFEFSTGADSRKARNFRTNPNVAIATESGAEAVVIEGVVSVMKDARHGPFVAAYAAKYDWQLTPDMAPFYIVTPRIAFGVREFGDRETGGITRWTFE